MTKHLVRKFPLTLMWKLRFSIRSLYSNTTFTSMSTGGFAQAAWSPCTTASLQPRQARRTLRKLFTKPLIQEAACPCTKHTTKPVSPTTFVTLYFGTYLGGGREDGDGGILPPVAAAVGSPAEGRPHARLQSKSNLNKLIVFWGQIYIIIGQFCKN